MRAGTLRIPSVMDASGRIRVVLAEMPPMLRDIVRDTLQRAPDMAVVAEVDRGMPLREALEAFKPDVVIVGTSEPADSALPKQLLLAMPQARVLMLAMSGRSAVMYELRPHRV